MNQNPKKILTGFYQIQQGLYFIFLLDLIEVL